MVKKKFETGIFSSQLYLDPKTSAFGNEVYPTFHDKAAVLFHSLIKNHPFLDGNRRTAFGSMHMMLLLNGRDLKSSFNEEVKLCMDTIENKLDISEISDWIKNQSIKK